MNCQQIFFILLFFLIITYIIYFISSGENKCNNISYENFDNAEKSTRKTNQSIDNKITNDQQPNDQQTNDQQTNDQQTNYELINDKLTNEPTNNNINNNDINNDNNDNDNEKQDYDLLDDEPIEDISQEYVKKKDNLLDNNIIPKLNNNDINMIINKEKNVIKKYIEEDDDFNLSDIHYEPYIRKNQKLCKANNKKWYEKFMKKNKYYNKVDKINQLRNEMNPFIKHDTSVDMYSGQKISDIYDELTKNNAKCYSKKCLKKPYVDPYTGNSYYFSNNTNQRTITNSNWEYENECTMNGGVFDGNVYGVDPLDGEYTSLAI